MESILRVGDYSIGKPCANLKPGVFEGCTRIRRCELRGHGLCAMVSPLGFGLLESRELWDVELGRPHWAPCVGSMSVCRYVIP